MSPEIGSDKDAKKSTTGLVVGSVSLALLVVVLAIGLIVVIKRRNAESAKEEEDDTNQDFFTFPQEDFPQQVNGPYQVGQRVPNQFVHVQNKVNPAYASSAASSHGAPIELQSRFEARFEGGKHSLLRPATQNQTRTAIVKV